VNAFIRKAKENGSLAELQEKWFGETEPKGKLDYASLTGENGTLRLAVAPDLKPISYIKDGEATGYEMELLVQFAKEYGYGLEMSYVTFDAILPGVTTGKYDIGTGAVTITEERAQSVSFSESHLTVDVVMVVRAEEDSATKVSFWNEVKESFEKTFIREDRWKLIVQGIGVTMLISVCAALIGSLFGFGLYMLSRSDIKVIEKLTKGFAKGYSRIIAGTPVVVVLMILFYVIFGQVRDMSGIIVAIIGFTLTFGAFVYDHMTVSVGSVDRGQIEAAYALGYTKSRTFFRIIFPQAMHIFLPSYCGQAVELIKATAVVGYIAVNDLTKMGDIIRSNTYEAFFPLIATALIYFFLTWVLSLLLGFVKLRFEPKRRSAETILKGVKTK
jgi:polar amino acid transport system substrate-binding protein